MNETILQVNGLCIDYGLGGHAVRAVHDVDLTLHRGETLGLAGESGSGKSSLAYGLTRLLPPPGVISGGSVRYHPPGATPLELLSLSAAQLRRFRWAETAIVFQSAMNALNPVHKLVTQLTDVLAAHQPRMRSAARRDRAAELLSMVGLAPDLLDRFPHELSGGMRQRVMIGMALALEPRIVILDEPTTALDMVTQRQVIAQLMSLRRTLDFAVLFITHDLALLIEHADRIAVMYAGRIVEQAPATDLYWQPRHPYTEGLLRSYPPLQGPRRELAGIPGFPPHPRNLPGGCAFHPRCPKAFGLCADRLPETIRTQPDATVMCWLHTSDRDPGD